MTAKRPAQFDGWTLFKGGTFIVEFTYQDKNGATIDLSSGFSAEMQIRRKTDGTLIATLDSAGGGDGSITLSSSKPNVSGKLDASFTSSLELVDGEKLEYDFKLIGTITEIILEGTINAEVPVTQ